MKPTLTLNAGLRWDLQLPFTRGDADLLRRDDRRYLRHLRRRRRAGRPAVQPLQAGHADRRAGTGAYDLYEPGAPAYDTNWTNFAPNVGIAWRPNVQGGLPADAARRSRAGHDPRRLRDELQPGAHRPVRGQRQRQSRRRRSTSSATTRRAIRSSARARAIRCSSASATASARRASRRRRSIRSRRRRPTTSRCSSRICARRASTPTRSASSGRSAATWRSKCATSATRTCTPGPRRTGTSATSSRTASSTSSGWRRPTSRANLAAGRGTTSFAYTGAPGTSAAADLPRVPQRPRRRDQHGGLHGDAVHQLGVPRAGSARSSRKCSTPRSDLDTTAFRANAARAGFVPNFFVMNPAVGNANVVEDRNSTKFNSMQLEVRRRLSRRAARVGQLHLRRPQGRRSIDRCTSIGCRSTRRDVPHAFKANWVYQIPVGRGQPLRHRHERASSTGLIGGWEFSGQRAIPEPALPARRREARGDDPGGVPGHVQDSHRPEPDHGPDAGVQLPAGHHRQHPRGVQHAIRRRRPATAWRWACRRDATCGRRASRAASPSTAAIATRRTST